MKTIDFNLMVAELVKAEPQVAELLSGLGLGNLVSPEALQVMGNIMTIPRAAAMKGLVVGIPIAVAGPAAVALHFPADGRDVSSQRPGDVAEAATFLQKLL